MKDRENRLILVEWPLNDKKGPADKNKAIEILPWVITDGSIKVSQKNWSKVIPPKKSMG